MVDETPEQTPEISEAEKLKAENDSYEKEIQRAESLRQRAQLAGKSFMTPPPVVETADEKWEREARERYKGTGLDPTPKRR